MDWNYFFIALALVLVIEGIMPFLNPASLRKTLILIVQMSDRTIRAAGLASMLLGILILHLAHR